MGTPDPFYEIEWLGERPASMRVSELQWGQGVTVGAFRVACRHDGTIVTDCPGLAHKEPREWQIDPRRDSEVTLSDVLSVLQWRDPETGAPWFPVPGHDEG
jgi:hypothetical protein